MAQGRENWHPAARCSFILRLAIALACFAQSSAELVLNFDSSSSSYLAYSGWDGSTSGQLEFWFRTLEPTSLLFYQDDGRVDGDYLVLSFEDGDLQLDVRMQSEPEEGEDGHRNFSSSSDKNLVDGEWHSILVERLNGSRRRFKVRVDGETWVNFKTGDGRLDASGLAYFGGLPADVDPSRLPLPELAKLQHFTGCMRGIRYVDKDGAELSPVPLTQRQSVGLGSTCGVLDATCSVEGCQNGGKCSAMWTGLCDCRGTMKTGASCADGPATATFRSGFFVDVDLGYTTQLTDLFFRLKTDVAHQPEGRAEVLAATDASGEAGVWVYLLDGEISVEVRATGGEPLSLSGGSDLDDGDYHVVHVELTGSGVQLTVDDNDTLSDSVSSEHTLALQLQVARLGRFVATRSEATGTSSSAFTGWMTDVVLNEDVRPLDLLLQSSALDAAIYNSLTSTVRIDATALMNERPLLSDAINFNHSTEGFYLSRQWLFRKKGHLTFHLKTVQQQGIIAYQQGGMSQKAAGNELNYAALLVRNGNLMFSYHNGDDVIEAESSMKINDGLWHQVVARRSARDISFLVDGRADAFRLPHHVVILSFPKEEQLLVGATPAGLTVSGVSEGYVGCLRHFYASGSKEPVTLRELSENLTDVVPYCPACEPANPCGANRQCIEGNEESEDYECEVIITTAPPTTAGDVVDEATDASTTLSATSSPMTSIPSSEASTHITTFTEDNNTTGTEMGDTPTTTSEIDESSTTQVTTFQTTAADDNDTDTVVVDITSTVTPSATIAIGSTATILLPPSSTIHATHLSTADLPSVAPTVTLSAPVTFDSMATALLSTAAHATGLSTDDLSPAMSSTALSASLSIGSTATTLPPPSTERATSLSAAVQSQASSSPTMVTVSTTTAAPGLSLPSMPSPVVSTSFIQPHTSLPTTSAVTLSTAVASSASSTPTPAAPPVSPSEVVTEDTAGPPTSEVPDSATTPGKSTTEAAATTPGQSTTEAAATTPGKSTTEAAATTPGKSTTEAAATTPGKSTTEAAATTPGKSTTEAAATTPGKSTTEAAATTPGQSTTEAAATTPGKSTTEAAATTASSPREDFTTPPAAAQATLQFTTPEAFVPLPALPLSATKPISLKFNTGKEGIALYAGGAGEASDFVGLAIFPESLLWQFSVNGHVHNLRLQSPAGESYFTDGSWYDVDILHGTESVTLSSDGASNTLERNGTGSLQPRLADSAQLGASSGNRVGNISTGFVGKVGAVELGDETVDLAAVSKNVDGVQYTPPKGAGTTTATPGATPPVHTHDDSGGLSGGAIAGIVIGCLVVVILVALIILVVIFAAVGKTRGIHRLEESPEYPMKGTFVYI